MRTLLLVAGTLLLGMVGSGLAHLTDCAGTVITVETPAGTFYYNDRGHNGALPPVTGFVQGHGIWLYQESNGIAGLQRGGQQVVLAQLGLGSEDEEIRACWTANPDTLLL